MRGATFSRAVLGAALGAIFGGCGGSTPSSPHTVDTTTGGNPKSVTVGTSAFTPSGITVPVNSTVTWNWNSCTGDPYYGQTCVSHSVTFDDATLGGSAVQASGIYSKAFASKGVYTYHCSIHGQSMSGTVTVQ